MIRPLAIAFTTAIFAAPAAAQDAKPLTIEQCINILAGLNSLSYVGQQYNDSSKPPGDAKQYKLGPARMTIATDIAALSQVLSNAQRAQQGFQSELPPLPAAEPGKPDSSARVDAANEQNKAAAKNWRTILDGPCNVQPGHLNAPDLKIGDGPDENSYPPPVLGALVPIIDGLKK
jgi:hypothetical protein